MAMLTFDVILTQKGKKSIIDNAAYIFNLNKTVETKSSGPRFYWCCMKSNCSATIITDAEYHLIKRGSKAHSHDGDPILVLKHKAESSMRQRTMETVETSSQIVHGVRSNVSEPVLLSLASAPAMFKRVQRQKRIQRGLPDDHLDTFMIPEHLKYITIKNARFEEEAIPFLLYDSQLDTEAENIGAIGDDTFAVFENHLNETDECVPEEAETTDGEERMIIFGTEEGLILLRSSEHWFGDGTFDVCPSQFNQIFTLHARYETSKITLPCLYVMLKRKTQSTYVSMFRKVKELVGERQPTHYMSDYEKAQMNGFQIVYPEAAITGCLFHLAQNIRRHCVTHGLKLLLDSDPLISIQSKYIRAMAYVPADDVKAVWDELIPHFDINLKEVVRYFDTTYVGTTARAPLFNAVRWSVFDRTMNGDARSNNSVEAYHGGLKKFFDHPKPSPLTFVDLLKKYHGKVIKDMIILRVGRDDRAVQRKAWKDNDANNLKLVMRYYEYDNKVQYIKDMAGTMK